MEYSQYGPLYVRKRLGEQARRRSTPSQRASSRARLCPVPTAEAVALLKHSTEELVTIVELTTLFDASHPLASRERRAGRGGCGIVRRPSADAPAALLVLWTLEVGGGIEGGGVLARHTLGCEDRWGEGTSGGGLGKVMANELARAENALVTSCLRSMAVAGR